MELSFDAEQQLMELADALAELKIHAATAAWQILSAEIFRILIEKGLMTLPELDQRLKMIEDDAAKRRATAPETSDAMMHMTMSLRHAFDLTEGEAN